MSKFRNFAMSAALAFATIAPVTVAEAAPFAPVPLKIEKKTDVTDVRVVCNRWGCRRTYWGPRVVVRPRVVYRPRVWVAPRVVIRPAPRYVVRQGMSRHVRWCLNRYASYNPGTDTFLSYDGYYKRCNSPFR
ncbi:BA14K family protein [Rhizobium alvei]|uniref:Lectin-like protein BA14k n=1 Tax=Rhizobium alvei TaxID=1132659 RepID=A0ABT8YF72_9HYPH|nr:BA14K family protein [Rhizobium alvei]MDO6962374.1 BA14K family protein [Rhizobium alvei]